MKNRDKYLKNVLENQLKDVTYTNFPLKTRVTIFYFY